MASDLEHPHFTDELWRFLIELSQNNERSWFDANKQRYEDHVRGPALALIRAMAPRLADITPALRAIDKKVGGSLMRVYRDVRFSKDKTPYKTNVGIQFRHRAGKDVHAPGVYVHIDIDELFVGAGLWQPDRAPLAAIRTRIAESPDGWRAIIESPPFTEGPWAQHGDSLKRVPRGFDEDHPLAEELKRKSFIAVRPLDPALIESPELCDTLAEHVRTIRPYMAFLCEAVGVEL